MRQEHKAFRAIEVGDGGDGRWAAYAQGLWQEMDLLETCDTVDEAFDKLRSLPVAVPQNLTLVDPKKAMTVFVGPDMPPTVAPDACAANHQHLPVTDEQERALRTQERLRAIRAAGADVAAMLEPPLYRSVDEQGSRTLAGEGLVLNNTQRALTNRRSTAAPHRTVNELGWFYGASMRLASSVPTCFRSRRRMAMKKPSMTLPAWMSR